MLLLSLIVLIFSTKTNSVSISSQDTAHPSTEPKQAFSWDLNESYKHISSNPESGEEHTSVHRPEHPPNWGSKQRKSTETRPRQIITKTQPIENPVRNPKRARTLIAKPRHIDENDQEALLNMVHVKQARGKGKRYRATEKSACDPHTPSCEHWHTLDQVQRGREKRKIRYYAMVSKKRRNCAK